MAKFLGFLLGVAVALAGPAVFGVLAAPGGIELNAKELALAFGIGALVFWAVVSYFSGAGALGAFVAFGTLVYCWLWIPNRTTNFLNDVPGVTTGMIEGSKQYTINGVVPILGVISLVYAIQLIVRSVQRRRRVRAEDERLQREQEAAQAQQEADVAAVYPVAGGTYAEAPAYESHSRYDDLFDEPEPVQPRNQADDQTRQFPVAGQEFEHTQQFPEADARGNYVGDETVAAPVQEDESTAAEAEAPQAQERAEEDAAEREPRAEGEASAQQEHAAQEAPAAEPEPVEETQAMPVAETQTAPEAETEQVEAKTPETNAEEATPVTQTKPVEQTQAMPVAEAQPVEQTKPVEQTQAMPVAETQTAPAAETEPVEAKASETKAEDPEPVEKTQAMPVAQTEPAAAKAPKVKAPEVKAAEAKAQETTPQQGEVEEKSQQPKAAEFVGEKKVAPKEQVGSQYRERMEDPEDTGEFYLAFENPVVKPA